MDATSTLTHNVEKAFQDQDVVTALAFNIKRAFDRVIEARLIKRLWKQDSRLPIIR